MSDDLFQRHLRQVLATLAPDDVPSGLRAAVVAVPTRPSARLRPPIGRALGLLAAGLAVAFGLAIAALALNWFTGFGRPAVGGTPTPSPSASLGSPSPSPSPSLSASSWPTLKPSAVGLALINIDVDRATPLVAAAVQDPWTTSALAGDRAAAVAVEDGGPKGEIVVYIYDYDRSRVLAIEFSADGRSIVDRLVTGARPDFSPDERDHARSLVASSAAVKGRTAGRGYTICCLAGADPDAFAGHRVVAVILMSTTHADPVLVAYADLSADRVVRVDSAADYEAP